MLTFEKVLAGFKDYLDEDKRYEILMTSRGYVILEWGSNQTLEDATFCPTPEVMKETLLGVLEGYLEYRITLCGRDLTDGERHMIQEKIAQMSNFIR